VILDGEFVSLEGDLYDFLSARAHMNDRLALRVWDILSVGLDMPLSKRRSYLEKNMRQTEKILLVPQEIKESKKEILDYFDKVIQQGYEGIILKPDAGYYAKWLKLRKIHSQDVVILGIKKTDSWNSEGVPATFLIGYYDPETGKFKRLGDVSSGLTYYEKAVIGEVGLVIKTGEDKDYVYLEPTFVIEVSYYEKREKGLRFPKIVRLRFDKRPEECPLLEFFGVSRAMQSKLIEGTDLNPQSRISFDYVCVNCKVDRGDPKYPAVWKRGAWRVLLEHIVGNIWRCTCCGLMHLSKDFYPLAHGNRKKECSHCGGRAFYWDRQRRELVCRLCGLVA